MNLKRALQIIDGGAWLTGLRYITADVNKGTGGKVIELTKCRITRSSSPLSPGRGDGGEAPNAGASGIQRNPNHSFHFTRNMVLHNNQVRKVHPILITHVNQEEVI